MADVREITDAEFAQEVQDEKITVVDFWAPWCGPCKMIAPRLEQLAGRYPDSVRIRKINVDEHTEIAKQHGISSIPTLLFFRKGQLVHRIVGAVSVNVLEEAIQKALAV